MDGDCSDDDAASMLQVGSISQDRRVEVRSGESGQEANVDDREQAKEERVQERAARALGRFGKSLKGTVFVQPLLVPLKSSRWPAVRKAAALALGEIGDSVGAESLIEALHDPSMEVRLAATEALGMINSSEAVVPLLRIARGEEDCRAPSLVCHQWNITALTALGRLASPDSVETLGVFSNAAPDLREASVWALAQIRSEQVVPILMRYYFEDPVHSIQEHALQALVSHHDYLHHNVVPDLIDRLLPQH